VEALIVASRLEIGWCSFK